jgi:iron complex transport system substrate-binding protein
MQRLGDMIGESEKAAQAAAKLQARLDAVRQRVAQLPAVPTLIIMQEGGFGTVGPGKFIDQALTIAGGRNVVITEGWPTLDREQVLATGAEAVIELLPDAPPHVVEQSRARWKSLGDLPAVRNNRVYTLNDWYLLRSGDHVVEMAEKFAECLHPQQFQPPAATQP